MKVPKYIRNRLGGSVTYGKVISTSYNYMDRCGFRVLYYNCDYQLNYFVAWPDSYIDSISKEEYLISTVLES